MSVDIEIWFRSGSPNDLLVEKLENPEWYDKEVDSVPFAACPGLAIPPQHYESSVFAGFNSMGDSRIRENARSLGLEGLCIVNFRRAIDELLPPEDPMSAFWIDNVDVRRAEEAAESSERMLQMIEGGRWNELQYLVKNIERTKLDGYYRGVPVSDAEFIEVVVNDLTLISGHCRWFAANRKPPVLVSAAFL